MRRLVVLGVFMGVTLVGCAAFQQAKADYDVGKVTPMAEGEVSPSQAAHSLIDPIKDFLPTPVQPVAGVAVILLTVLGTWNRGRRIRKQLVSTPNPITGFWGQKVGLEAVVQQIASVAHGLFEVGPENSGLRRAWKIAISGLLAVAVLPPVQTFATTHPALLTEFLAALAAIGGLEKELSKVLPTAPPSA